MSKWWLSAKKLKNRNSSIKNRQSGHFLMIVLLRFETANDAFIILPLCFQGEGPGAVGTELRAMKFNCSVAPNL